ncbi:hypothetical protein N8T08_000464 [Aspergillus melleus]|uniref:Uncharacterized protein n=1 Tax=Aspergillus melleus TaxID=138277 RepID=A0ACC3BBY0_9EURO|nr:hypothetical protein N8T08_000464 [Aspergillus melleus]
MGFSLRLAWIIVAESRLQRRQDLQTSLNLTSLRVPRIANRRQTNTKLRVLQISESPKLKLRCSKREMSDDQTVASSGIVRACDPCRSRKIRCDRKVPCSNCQLAGARCSRSERAPRQKQARVLISSQYESKIDRIESQLEQLITAVDKLSPNAAFQHGSTEQHPTPNHSILPRSEAYQGSVSYQGSQSEPKDVDLQGAVDEQVMEGQSSLSAHSSFAINLLHNAVGANTSEIARLLETLRHILGVSNDQRASSSRPLLPLAMVAPSRCSVSNMPPLEKMLFVLQQAKDNDITLPLPGASTANESAMEYFGHTVRLAGLAGRIYEQLYCATALSLPTNTRQARVTELSQELHGLIDASHAARDSWIGNASDDSDRQTAVHTSMSGDVLRLSMLTLIHRAMPHNIQQTTISDECIVTARYALEKHEAMIKHLELKGPILLTSYINWSILFVPFVPFIALFCHVIETGDLDDLTRMQTFVTSLESACASSKAIAKHHRLFQVFNSVALRYTELRGASPASQGETARLRMEMDTQLHALGLQVRAGSVPAPSMPGVGETDIMGAWHGAEGMARLGHFSAGVDPLEEQSQQLGNWFSFGQNMMELVDENEWL